IEPVGPEPFQAALAGLNRAAPRRVLGEHLADEKHLVRASRDRRAHTLLGAAVGIHFRGIDQPHAEVETETQRRDLRFAPAAILAHHPGALPQRGHALAARKLRRRDRFHEAHLHNAGCASFHRGAPRSSGGSRRRDRNTNSESRYPPPPSPPRTAPPPPQSKEGAAAAQ